MRKPMRKRETMLFIYKYFECEHYQCLKTTILLHYCIQCGNDKLKNILIDLNIWIRKTTIQI